jgi:hypothetical protein
LQSSGLFELSQESKDGGTDSNGAKKLDFLFRGLT